MIDDFDVDNITIDNRDLPVLAVIGCIVVDCGRFTVVIGVFSGDRRRIVVGDEFERHAYNDVAPANVVVPCPAKTGWPPQNDEAITIRVGAPEVAPPVITTVLEPVSSVWVRSACKYGAVR